MIKREVERYKNRGEDVKRENVNLNRDRERETLRVDFSATPGRQQLFPHLSSVATNFIPFHESMSIDTALQSAQGVARPFQVGISCFEFVQKEKR